MRKWASKNGPVRLTLDFTYLRPKGHFKKHGDLSTAGKKKPYPTVKPDLTKLVRAVEDALTGLIWRDDTQVVYQSNSKTYGSPQGVTVLIEEIKEVPVNNIEKAGLFEELRTE